MLRIKLIVFIGIILALGQPAWSGKKTTHRESDCESSLFKRKLKSLHLRAKLRPAERIKKDIFRRGRLRKKVAVNRDARSRMPNVDILASNDDLPVLSDPKSGESLIHWQLRNGLYQRAIEFASKHGVGFYYQ